MVYSNDLRKGAVEYFLQNTKRYQEVAGLFRVAVGTFHHWVNEYISTVALEPRKSTGRHRITTETQHQVLREFVGKNADNSRPDHSPACLAQLGPQQRASMKH